MNKLAQLDFNTLLGPNNPVQGGQVNVNRTQTLGGIVFGLIPYIYAAAGIALMFYIISAGLSYMTAAGDPKKVQAAQAKLKNGFLGFLVVFTSYWIVQIIGNIFNLGPVLDIF